MLHCRLQVGSIHPFSRCCSPAHTVAATWANIAGELSVAGNRLAGYVQSLALDRYSAIHHLLLVL